MIPLYSQKTICYDRLKLEIIANKIEKGRQFQEENNILKQEIDTLNLQLNNLKQLKTNLTILNNNNNSIINQSLVIQQKLEAENESLRKSLNKSQKAQRNTLIIGGSIAVGLSIVTIVAIIAK